VIRASVWQKYRGVSALGTRSTFFLVSTEVACRSCIHDHIQTRAATFQYPIIPQRCALAGHRAGSTQHGIDRPFLSNPPPRHTCTSLRRAPALPDFGFHTAREKKSTHRNAIKFYQSHFHFRPSSSLSDSTLRMAGTNSNHESKSDRGPITIPPIESNVVVTTKEEMDESDRALVAMGYKPVSLTWW